MLQLSEGCVLCYMLCYPVRPSICKPITLIANTLSSSICRCSVFLIDPETDELVAKVFDGISSNDKQVGLRTDYLSEFDTASS